MAAPVAGEEAARQVTRAEGEIRNGMVKVRHIELEEAAQIVIVIAAAVI